MIKQVILQRWLVCFSPCHNSPTVEIGKHDLTGNVVLKQLIVKSENSFISGFDKVTNYCTIIFEKNIQVVQRVVTLHGCNVFQLNSRNNHIINLQFLNDIFVYNSILLWVTTTSTW